MREESESYIQQTCLMWLNNNYGLQRHEPNRWMMFSIPNELAMGIRSALLELKLPQKYVDQAIALALKKASNTGFTPGVSDTIIVAPGGITLYIEFKTKIGRQSDEQIEFERRVTMLGHRYYLVRSLEEFKSIIDVTIKKLL